MSRPLAGLKVLDLSNTPSGANVGLFLADFGAEVVLAEPPGGSSLRTHPCFPFWARGKRSIELDLKRDTDRSLARGLALDHDVVIETWRPGVAERLGLGYADLRAEHPGLVYVSITGFGRQGPAAKLKGYEGLVMAKLGIMSAFHTGVLRDGPAFTAVPFASWSASQTALHGVLAALYEREASGVGQRVDTSLVQGVAAHDIWRWYVHIIRDRYPGALTPAPVFDDEGVPTGPLTFMVLVALTADGRWLQFSQIRPHLFRALIKALGLDWMYDDPEWSSLPDFDEAHKRSEFWNRLLLGVREKTLAEWQEVFDSDPNVWAETFRHGSELLNHPQFTHIGGPIEIIDPRHGPIRQPGPLVTLHSAEPALHAAAPDLDEYRQALRAGTSQTSKRAPNSEPPATPALDGVIVLELGSIYAGPFGATLLADLGARVIKVEPLEGDPIRSMQPFPEIAGIKAMQGKESIALDIGTDDGRAIVYRLAELAHLAIQAWRGGVATRLGVDAESLRGVNPNLVYLNASGYGNDGPCANKPSFAPTIGAAVGLGMRCVGDSFPESPDLDINEIRRRSKQLLGFNNNMYAQSDGFAAVANASALLLGLLSRRRGGPAQNMSTTMLMSVAHALADQVIAYADKPEPAMADPEIFGLCACYRLYATADGWVFLAAPAEHEWLPMATALKDHVALADDPRFSTHADRRAHDDALAALLSKCFSTRDSADWERDLTAADVGCITVAPEPVEDVLQGEFGRSSGLVVDVVHPTIDEHPRLAPLVSLSRTPAEVRPGCLAGQHTDAILAELGYTAADIASLRDRKIVG